MVCIPSCCGDPGIGEIVYEHGDWYAEPLLRMEWCIDDHDGGMKDMA
jgi:hypothetical protein